MGSYLTFNIWFRLRYSRNRHCRVPERRFRSLHKVMSGRATVRLRSTSDATSRRGKQVTIRLRLTSGATRRRRRLWRGKQVTVAPGIERGELDSEEETDYATTE
jgi:hypothetical protein